MHMTDQEKSKQITALLRERDMAEQRGDRDTVSAIAGELSRLGARAAAPAQRAAKRPAPKRDKRRSEE